MPFSFRANPNSTPKTPTKHDDASIVSTSNKSSTIQKMQPRDFGLRGSTYATDKQSRENAFNGTSFAKLADVQARNLNQATD